jgi:hypothetical protein
MINLPFCAHGLDAKRCRHALKFWAPDIARAGQADRLIAGDAPDPMNSLS